MIESFTWIWFVTHYKLYREWQNISLEFFAVRVEDCMVILFAVGGGGGELVLYSTLLEMIRNNLQWTKMTENLIIQNTIEWREDHCCTNQGIV